MHAPNHGEHHRIGLNSRGGFADEVDWGNFADCGIRSQAAASTLFPGSLAVMAQTGTHQSSTSSPAPQGNMPSGARIDPAHPIGDEDAVSSEARQPLAFSSPTEQLTDDLAEQLRLQGEQLAAELQRRRDQLDRRESRLNARDAEQDNEARGLRMWLVERQQELDEREKALLRRERDVEDRSSQIIAAEAFQESSQTEAQRYVQKQQAVLDRRQSELAAREHELALRDAAFETAQAELDQARHAFDATSTQHVQRIDTRRESSLQMIRLGLEGLERRRQEVEQQAVQVEALRKRLQTEDRDHSHVPSDRMVDLERRERLVEEGFELIDHRRQALKDLELQLKERADAQLRQLRRDRQQLLTQEQQLELRNKQTLEKFQQRESELDARQAALDQLRESLGKSQRESLELRLATEELWNQLVTKFPAPALTASLGQIRAQLADHDRQVRQELLEHRQKLEVLRDQLIEQHARLDQKKREHQAWVDRRTKELDERTNAITARGFNLQEQQQAIEHLQHDWSCERLALQDQVQALMRQLRDSTVAA